MEVPTLAFENNRSAVKHHFKEGLQYKCKTNQVISPKLFWLS